LKAPSFNKPLEESIEKSVSQELTEEKILDAKESLHYLPESDARDFLSTSLSIYRTNKFYDAFKALFEEKNTSAPQ
jgi:hypothetical protein